MNQLDIRDVFFDKLYELGSQNSNIIIISADMDAFSLRKFATDFPKQYMNIGVSEQNMINVAAGLAIAGKIVFCYSIASFATLKPPLTPLIVTRLKSSKEVWYSGYSPYFVLKIEEIFKSIPGELNCLSSEPLFKNEYILYFFILSLL